MAGISVVVTAGLTAATSSVTATGSVQHVITDNEVNSFKIQDGPLKNAVGKAMGKNPNDAYLHSPTPWNDLYSTYGWPQVQTILVVQSATITGITSQPTIVATQKFINNSNIPGTFNVGISQNVTNTTETNWSQTNTIDVSQSINYEIGFLGTGGGGSTTMSYSYAWAQGGSQSQSVALGSSQGVSVDLQPGQAVNAQLTASKGTMNVRIVYKAYLMGATAINYNPTFNGHHFYACDIGNVMGAGGIANQLTFTEDIQIGFFSNSQVELTNPDGSQVKALPAMVGAPRLLAAV
jgi:hypothetical protein